MVYYINDNGKVASISYNNYVRTIHVYIFDPYKAQILNILFELNLLHWKFN